MNARGLMRAHAQIMTATEKGFLLMLRLDTACLNLGQRFSVNNYNLFEETIHGVICQLCRCLLVL